MTMNDRLAAFFRQHPNEWLGARQLEIAGRQAWRTRVSDLRKPPYSLTIENRVRVVRSDKPLLAVWESRHYRLSEYRFCPAQSVLDSDARKNERPSAMNAEPFSTTGNEPDAQPKS